MNWTQNAPKSRDSLRLRRRFWPLPKEITRSLEAPRCAISSAKKIANEPRFLLRRKWVKMVFAAEFLAIPSSAVKIASEWRCAILVHSAQHMITYIYFNQLLVIININWRNGYISVILETCYRIACIVFRCQHARCRFAFRPRITLQKLFLNPFQMKCLNITSHQPYLK